ncbi:hypothetical protein [Aliagarivorans taiwanensis]|uniref:hypothetical protein n=1 Tax=Aliagarivorans taiwanensis TaxID=561966 RepID=UPI000422FEA3|nr:hypothetical protein [Aliagarivorans taiwanensis]
MHSYRKAMVRFRAHAMSALVITVLAITGCLPEDGTDKETPPSEGVPSPTSNTMVVNYSGGVAYRAEVYFDYNGDHIAAPSELIGLTDSKGRLQGDTLDAILSKAPSELFLVKVVANVTEIIHPTLPTTLASEDAWLLYPAGLLDLATANSRTSVDVQFQVSAWTSYIAQALVDNPSKSVTEIEAELQDQLVDVGDIDYFNDWYSSNAPALFFYEEGLERRALPSDATCCHFDDMTLERYREAVFDVSSHINSIINSGGTPDFDSGEWVYNQNTGGWDINLPSMPGGGGDMITSDGEYSESGRYATTTTSPSVIAPWFPNGASGDQVPHSATSYRYTPLHNGDWACAYISKDSGNPVFCNVALSNSAGSVKANLTNLTPVSAGSVLVEGGNGSTSLVTRWPHNPHVIESFGSTLWLGQDVGILGISGETSGGYIYDQGAWSGFDQTESVLVATKPTSHPEETAQTSYAGKSAYHHVVLNNGQVKALSEVRYTDLHPDEYYGTINERWGQRPGLATHTPSDPSAIKVRDEGDFWFLLQIFTHISEVIPSLGAPLDAPVFGRYEDRDQYVMGMASMRDDGSWGAHPSSAIDNEFRTLLESRYLHPEISAIYNHQLAASFIAGVELIANNISDGNPDTPIDYSVGIHRYHAGHGQWQSNFIDFAESVTDFAINSFANGLVMVGICNADGNLELYLWGGQEEPVFQRDFLVRVNGTQAYQCDSIGIVTEQTFDTDKHDSSENGHLILLGQSGGVEVLAVERTGGYRHLGQVSAGVSGSDLKTAEAFEVNGVTGINTLLRVGDTWLGIN